MTLDWSQALLSAVGAHAIRPPFTSQISAHVCVHMQNKQRVESAPSFLLFVF